VCNEFGFEEPMKWQEGNDSIEVMDGFKDFCGMLLVHGTIDAM
jgi:hypothetical protein